VPRRLQGGFHGLKRRRFEIVFGPDFPLQNLPETGIFRSQPPQTNAAETCVVRCGNFI
jgi:hypothetical protein